MKKVRFGQIGDRNPRLCCVYLGRGAVYSFDPVGSYEREEFRAGGSGGALIQPFLDSQVWPSSTQGKLFDKDVAAGRP